MASLYQQRIRETLAHTGHIGVQPHHVEAWMRVEHGALDHLNGARFTEEVQLAVACIAEAGTDDAEHLAQGYGLQPEVAP